jgi:hypothetical protein
LDAKLKCPLGGEYVFRAGIRADGKVPVPPPPGEKSEAAADAFGRWTSTALENQPAGGNLLHPSAPAGFEAPPLNWFRGLDLEATMNEKNLSAHANIIMQMPTKDRR